MVGIERGDLTSTSEFTGELGFGEAWPVPLTAEGIVTGARPLGTVVEFGQSLIEVDDAACSSSRVTCRCSATWS